MATLDDAHKIRWHLLDPAAGIPYVPENGIPTAWRAHPEWGSPIGLEQDVDDGGVVQPFSGGVVKWTADGGAVLVTE